jgi:hypothetical protein
VLVTLCFPRMRMRMRMWCDVSVIGFTLDETEMTFVTGDWTFFCASLCGIIKYFNATVAHVVHLTMEMLQEFCRHHIIFYGFSHLQLYCHPISCVGFLTEIYRCSHRVLEELSVILVMHSSSVLCHTRWADASLKWSFPTNKQTPWSESASELYRPSDRRFSVKWLPTFADKGATSAWWIPTAVFSIF